MHSVGRVALSAPRISARFAHSASSSRWLARQKSDPFVRQRAERGPSSSGAYRSRAAFKLLEIQEKFDLIRKGNTVVDLGCAPGAWLQVAADIALKDGGKGRIIGVDLLRTDPVENVTAIQGDFLDYNTQMKLSLLLAGKAREPQSAEQLEPAPPTRCVDVVLSDMAPSITGNRVTDVANTVALTQAATMFATHFLTKGDPTRTSLSSRGGGSLVIKYFEHPELVEFKKEYLDRAFRKVFNFKPKSSRSESSETYWVCMNLL